MQTGLVIGVARATTKHPSIVGHRLLIVQPLGVDDAADGPPQLVIDPFGARPGDHLLLTSDGKQAQQVLQRKDSPVRWTSLGLVDSHD